MTPEQLKQLNALNAEVNADHVYVSGLGPAELPDSWKDAPIDGESWVCRNYAQAKADRLRDAGYTGFYLVLCWTEPCVPESEQAPGGRLYHAVEALDVDGETWILDSRFDAIYRQADNPHGYVWYERQVAGTTRFEPYPSV